MQTQLPIVQLGSCARITCHLSAEAPFAGAQTPFAGAPPPFTAIGER